MTETSQKELIITRVFDAPRELVYQAWTDPKLLAQWFAPDIFTVPYCEVDARPGGSIALTMRGPDGVEYPMIGTFEQVVPPERLVYTSGAVMDAAGRPQLETLTTVTFQEESGKTKMNVTIQVTRATGDANWALAGMEEGWKQNMRKLAALINQSR